MIDVAVAFEKYKFLGSEFLLWLWFSSEERDVNIDETGEITINVANKITLLDVVNVDDKKTVTIKGNDIEMEEAMTALKMLAMPIELHLLMKNHKRGLEWTFTIKSETLQISGCKTPDVAPTETSNDIAGATFEKLCLLDIPVQFIAKLFEKYIAMRLDADVFAAEHKRMVNWIAEA